MKTFTNCAEKKAKQFLNLLQGYTKGIRMTAILVILLMGVSNAWANGGIGYKGVKFTKDGTTTGWYNIHNVTWDYVHNSYECRSGKSGVTDFNNADLGTVTSLKLHSFVVIGWTDNSDWVSGQLKYRTYLQSASAGNYNVYNVGNYETYCNAVDVLITSDNNRVVGKNGTMDVTLVDNNTTPGKYYLQLQGMGRMRYCNGDFNTNNGSEVKASYTVPGFAKTTASQDFGSVGVGSNISKTISFTNHYGTKLTTSNCVLSGTNKSEFSVTSISETEVTVKFTPSSVGTKSATLTITDAHSKKCTITLSGTATPPTYTVTFNANGHGTAPTAQTVVQGNTATTPAAPTETGYTFGGWYKEANCTNAFEFNTAITADITLYAKWTINQYTLTYSAGEGGTVSGNHASGSKLEYNTSITLTATPATGYIFVKWVEGSTQLSTNATYTFLLNADKNIQAVFAQYKTIYLKPGAWTKDNAKFAIYASSGNEGESYNMEQSDCNNEHYQCDINGKYNTISIRRMSNNGTGIWNEIKNLTIPEEGMCFYDRTKLYLKPNANWKQADARFAAYFFVAEDGNNKNKWMSMLATDEEGVFYCDYPTEHFYDRVIFCRMDPATVENNWNNKWNQTKNIDLFTVGNLYTITEGHWGDNQDNGATGTWSYIWKEPTYPLTLKATPYGEFTVKCNGVSHTSSRTKDIVINLPFESTIEITQSTSYHNAYNNNLVIKTSSNSQYEAAELNTTYTICGATTIQENFTTTDAHVVYLRVHDSKADAWNSTGTSNYVYSVNNLNTLNDIVGTVTKMDEVTTNNIYKENGYTYYTCTIPEDCNTFRFERKTAKDAGAINNTEFFEHLLPLGQSNCFTIEGKNNDKGTFYGSWGLSTANGDYRILYVEQQVAHGTGADAWKTVINTTYQHASDIIKKGDGETIVSLHIKYDKTKHPEVILQKFTNGEWVDVEGQAHMVLSPLTASADMAMLPGRRNAEGDVNLRYGDGIEKIKDDAADGKAGRVWNFVVQQSDASAYINFNANDFEPYSDDDDYYIRTDNAAGGWMTYTLPGNVMTHSDYALEHSGYSHYFCKWVEIAAGTPNTKFVVANKYGAAISDTIVEDKFTNEDGTLNANANVRWMWNEYTNEGSRAYIAGSTQDDFLKVFYEDSKSKKFDDKGEWVYEVDLTDVEVGKKLTNIKAMYQEKEQQLLEQTHQDAGGVVMLASTSVTKSIYTVRVVYDFKINQTLLYLLPTDQPVSTSIDVIIERINQDEGGNATQVKANITPANQEGLTVYGVITLTKDHITDPKKSEQEALTYWISFPFDVNIADISGFGEHGKDWILRKYNGAKRAEKGWFLDTPTFWERISEGTLEANTGYVLALHTRMLNESCPLYDNTTTLKLYFPSKDKITEDITAGWIQTTCYIPEHICTIEKPRDRRDADSNWNFIGVPSFANKNNKNSDLNYFYEYNFATDTYSAAKNDGPTTFRSMHAYMVQFGGTIDWSSIAENNAQQLAAKKNASAEDNYELRLELQQNGVKADQTFVELQEEGATEMFDMNIDLAKMFNAGANIYTIIGESKTEAAANVLPIANTVIPVGVQVATAGEYTFAMPDGTDGVVVELIDYEYNTRTNLLFREYTVNLPAGTNDTRFALSVKPDKTATSMENITTPSDGELRKFIIDGVLYMQKDGVLYDAQGKLVR